MTYRVAIGYFLFWLVASFAAWTIWLSADFGTLITDPNEVFRRNAPFIGAYLGVIGFVGWPIFGLSLTGLKRLGVDRPKADLLAGGFAGILPSAVLFGPGIFNANTVEAMLAVLLGTGMHALAGAVGAIAYFAFAGRRLQPDAAK